MARQDTTAPVTTVVELHRRACEAFGDQVHGIGPDQWHLPTPCAGWDVRQLVAHVVDENLWTPPLLAGQTIAEVGDRFAGDPLDDDPVAAWDRSVAEALAATAAGGAMSSTTHLSFGDVSGEVYAMQLFADHLVHGWDLARATGGDEAHDPELVQACADWFDENEDAYRSAGVIGPAASVADDADPQAALLARFGRDPSPDAPLAVLRRFNDAFGRADTDAVMALMTDDCVFEDTTPPDGGHHEGQAEVRQAFQAFFDASEPRFETEAGAVVGDRAVYRWRYSWDGGHVRGVDVFRVADGKVAEKLAYVKG